MSNKENIKNIVEQKLNKDMNYKNILSKTKKHKMKFINIAAVFLVLVIGLIGTSNIYARIKWNIEYKEFENRQFEYMLGAVKDAYDNKYEENIEMEYLFQDDVGVKIDSLMITDDYFKATVNFKFNKDIEINTDSFTYGYAVYDENKNIYGLLTPFWKMENNYWKNLYKELGFEKYNIYGEITKGKNFAGDKWFSTSSSGAMVNTSKENNLITEFSMDSRIGFPKSRTIYIRIFYISYWMVDFGEVNGKQQLTSTEEFPITEAEYIFKIDVPEKFYERETIELKLSEDIPGVELERLEMTETGLTLSLKFDEYLRLIDDGRNMDGDEFATRRDDMLNITDEEGNRILSTSGGTNTTGGYEAKFDVSKYKFNGQKLYLNVQSRGVDYKVEIIEK